jgi:hypothetical protein
MVVPSLIFPTNNDPFEISRLKGFQFQSNFEDLVIQWSRVQLREHDAIDLFRRMTCLDSNVVEDVFEFQGSIVVETCAKRIL